MSPPAAAATSREQLLTQLAKTAAPRGFRIAFDLLRDRAEAEDAVQEALARACAASDRLRDVQAIEAWFFRVLTNVSLRVLKRRRWQRLFRGWRGTSAGDAAREPTAAATSTLSSEALGAALGVGPSASAVPGGGGPDDALSRRQEITHMLDLLDTLPAQQRVALVLRYGHERPIADIAALLAVKPATVKTHLVRGLKRLRRAMQSVERTHEI
ncbi:MAG: hypothetical protein Tsb0020_09130 [Haliangiales bacterium]